jgi:hypothetical protein
MVEAWRRWSFEAGRGGYVREEQVGRAWMCVGLSEMRRQRAEGRGGQLSAPFGLARWSAQPRLSDCPLLCVCVCVCVGHVLVRRRMHQLVRCLPSFCDTATSTSCCAAASTSWCGAASSLLPQAGGVGAPAGGGGGAAAGGGGGAVGQRHRCAARACVGTCGISVVRSSSARVNCSAAAQSHACALSVRAGCEWCATACEHQ